MLFMLFYVTCQKCMSLNVTSVLITSWNACDQFSENAILLSSIVNGKYWVSDKFRSCCVHETPSPLTSLLLRIHDQYQSTNDKTCEYETDNESMLLNLKIITPSRRIQDRKLVLG